jgi:hypothetical protein
VTFTATEWKCVKISPRTLATKELAVTSRLLTVWHFLFHKEIFYQKQHDCHSPPTLLFPFPRLKTKLKGRHFDTIEVIEAESQTGLSILTEHDFQDAFKNGRSVGNGAYARKGTISRVMETSWPKVSFWSVLEIMDGSLALSPPFSVYIHIHKNILEELIVYCSLMKHGSHRKRYFQLVYSLLWFSDIQTRRHTNSEVVL